MARTSGTPGTHGSVYLFIRHKVDSYRKWERVVRAHGPSRKAHGSKGGQFLRSAEDPHELVILLRWESLDAARRFATSDEFRETLARAGELENLGTSAQ